MAYKKPTVYNPRLAEERIAELEAKVQHQAERINKLLEQNTNLQIKCRILEADKVELVRCKDCKHGHKVTPMDDGEDILCDYCDWEYFDNDFCSRGEARNGKST